MELEKQIHEEDIDDVMFREIGVSPEGHYLPSEIGNKYVAFCDILGFSSMVTKDFRGTLEAYHEFVKSIDSVELEEIEVIIYSDSILIVGDELSKVVKAVQLLWFMALSHYFLIRGAIAYGKYYERRSGKNLVVLSDALVKAVTLEKEVKVPAVVLADHIEVPDDYWKIRCAYGALGAGVLHFRDRNIVNPFNSLWLKSAANRVDMMAKENPQYSSKYEWFLALSRAVASEKFLIPEEVLERFVREGIVTLNVAGQENDES
ncbi:hypothetical protein [Crenobacter luteus]|uniref:hypothetical protein n=1 Tax=Crenobacter luteus TaxID=1452487 RepID=UPI001404A193|nr:hypothetical protein [Crenobacter luteus]